MLPTAVPRAAKWRESVRSRFLRGLRNRSLAALPSLHSAVQFRMTTQESLYAGRRHRYCRNRRRQAARLQNGPVPLVIGDEVQTQDLRESGGGQGRRRTFQVVEKSLVGLLKLRQRTGAGGQQLG